MNGGFATLQRLAMQHDRQRRQLVGTGTQHIVGNRAGIQGIEELKERVIVGQERAGMQDAVRRVFGFFGFGGTDGAHHSHGGLVEKTADRRATV